MLQLECRDKEIGNNLIRVVITNWSLSYTHRELHQWVKATYGENSRVKGDITKNISVLTGMYVVKFKVKTGGL